MGDEPDPPPETDAGADADAEEAVDPGGDPGSDEDPAGETDGDAGVEADTDRGTDGADPPGDGDAGRDVAATAAADAERRVDDTRLQALHDDLYATLEAAGDPEDLSAYVGAVSVEDMWTYTDRQVYELLLDSIFAPGNRWSDYQRYRDAVHATLGNYRRVATFDEADVERMLETRAMEGQPGRVRLAVLDAREFVDILEKYGSFAAYLERIDEADRAGERALGAVQKRFQLGPRGAREFLSNVGFRPVLRRERALGRTLARVGVVGDPRDFDAVEDVVDRISDRTGRPWPVVDRLFWAHGFGPDVIGLPGPVCGADPDCHRCLIENCAARSDPPTVER